jgi:hypothetical protein
VGNLLGRYQPSTSFANSNRWRGRLRLQDFLGFQREIGKSVQSDLDLHLILGKYATFKHPKANAWLAQ